MDVQAGLVGHFYPSLSDVIILQCSRDDIADKMRKNIKDANAVHIANPKTLEFQVCTFILIFLSLLENFRIDSIRNAPF